jgi:hypothetical protein
VRDSEEVVSSIGAASPLVVIACVVVAPLHFPKSRDFHPFQLSRLLPHLLFASLAAFLILARCDSLIFPYCISKRNLKTLCNLISNQNSVVDSTAGSLSPL